MPLNLEAPGISNGAHEGGIGMQNDHGNSASTWGKSSSLPQDEGDRLLPGQAEAVCGVPERPVLEVGGLPEGAEARPVLEPRPDGLLAALGHHKKGLRK